MGPVALTLLLLSALVGFGVNAWRKFSAWPPKEVPEPAWNRKVAEREGFEPSKGFWPLHP